MKLWAVLMLMTIAACSGAVSALALYWWNPDLWNTNPPVFLATTEPGSNEMQ